MGREDLAWATIRREALGLKCPVEPTEENLTTGLTLYEENCQDKRVIEAPMVQPLQSLGV